MGRTLERVGIVTGGAKGIGKTYCEALARQGARVVIADIDADRAEELAKELGSTGGLVEAMEVDVSSAADVERMAHETVARFGRIDILVNNAAMFQRPAVSRLACEDIEIGEWERVIAVNLTGVFLCCRAVIPWMKKQRNGKIVNISSGTAIKGVPNFCHYVTSKAGVIGLTRALARELGDYNITVNAIAPGFTLSFEKSDQELAEAREYAEKNMQARCLKRIETPEDLVGTLLFLCSSDSDFITGQTIAVDGGVVML